MSYFKDLFISPSEGFKVFLLHVGQHGDVVVYRLDDQGRPINLAAGRAFAVLAEPLQGADPCVFVTRHFDAVEEMQRPYRWFSGKAGGIWWRDTIAILNAGKGVPYHRAEAEYWSLRRFAPRIKEFIVVHEDDDGQDIYTLTPAALEADARREQPQEETSSS